jgi:hypothetical protein
MIKCYFINGILLGGFLCFLLVSLTLAGSAQYTYDSLNRLVQVQYDDGTRYTFLAPGL